jgi:phosphatidylserine decarboxylase
MIALAVALGSIATLFLLWRFYYFFRDPERVPPPGDDVLAPADGYVVYVHAVRAGEVPVAIKGRRSIPLEELTALSGMGGEGTLIGIFMTPASVHVNRAPIGGVIRQRVHRTTNRNRSMARVLTNLLVGRRPYAEDCHYLVENERNTIVIEGDRLTVAVTQIADDWVSNLVCRVAEGDRVERGGRYGMIRFGSQADLFIPAGAPIQVICREGEHVRAGESILARIERAG